jgi:hypothetical protein
MNLKLKEIKMTEPLKMPKHPCAREKVSPGMMILWYDYQYRQNEMVYPIGVDKETNVIFYGSLNKVPMLEMVTGFIYYNDIPRYSFTTNSLGKLTVNELYPILSNFEPSFSYGHLGSEGELLICWIKPKKMNQVYYSEIPLNTKVAMFYEYYLGNQENKP